MCLNLVPANPAGDYPDLIDSHLESDNFATWALGELGVGNEIGIVDNQVSTQTYAPDLASACIEILDYELTGLYHSTGPESVSRFEFTRTMADEYGISPDLVSPVSWEELGQEAPRPRDSSLDSSRLSTELGFEFSPLRTAFEAMRTKGDIESR